MANACINIHDHQEERGRWERLPPQCKHACRRLAFAQLFSPRLSEGAVVTLDDSDVGAAIGRAIGRFDRVQQSRWSALELCCRRAENGEPLTSGARIWVAVHGEGSYVSPAALFVPGGAQFGGHSAGTQQRSFQHKLTFDTQSTPRTTTVVTLSPGVVDTMRTGGGGGGGASSPVRYPPDALRSESALWAG